MIHKNRNLIILATAAAALCATASQATADVGAERSLEAAALKVRYDVLLHQARGFDAAPDEHLLNERIATERELRSGIDAMKQRVAEAREQAAQEAKFEADGGSIAGVSLATLEAIASCESGGDPSAVNPAGYYGKYQFDMGTWASVGGSGNPAEASEAEQDYRAALLYSRAGASPWPVCGA